MPTIELSKKQVNHMLTEYIQNEISTEEFHDLLKKLSTWYSLFVDADIQGIKTHVDALYKKRGN